MTSTWGRDRNREREGCGFFSLSRFGLLSPPSSLSPQYRFHPRFVTKMTTMSDDGERTCPLCTEEMDLTDQQLKPCKCGYEICVWCWHHIIDMAEKEDTEGRCPACRTPYDKERIVGMATNSRRLATEASAEKKQKSQKLKPKTSVEAKKHLNSVRVIQRNLVYIIGLPSNLCEESILERKEYFGQYGKVLKVSISRPTSAPSQQTSNNTLSGYITYAKESEAIKCIQAVHNYVLEGKSLRACFGTTKYCHAWLKNMICSNPDCLYLHDIGSQEDSFTKDEIVSAYTRSRVPQVASANSQRRFGNVLPPPMDEFLSNGCKNHSRSTTSSAPIQVKGSPPKNSGKSTGLPAATSWGDRCANCHSSTANVAFSQPIKQKAEAINDASSPPLLSKNTNHPAAWHDDADPTLKKPEVRAPPMHPSAWEDEIADMKVPERKEMLKASGISQRCESIKLDTWKGCQLMGSSNTCVDSNPTSRTSECNDTPMIKPKPSDEGNVSYSKTRQIESLGPVTELKRQTYVSDVSSVGVSDAECATEMSLSGIPILMVSTSKNKEPGMLINVKSCTQSSDCMSNDHGRSSLRTDPERVREDSTSMDGITQSLNSNFSAVSIDSDAAVDQLNVEHRQNSKYSFAFSRSQDPTLIPGSVRKDPSLFDLCGQNVVTDRTLKSLKQGLTSTTSRMVSRLLHCDSENHTVSDKIDHPSSSSYHNHSQTCDVEKKKILAIGKNIDGVFQTALSLRDKEPLLTNGYKDDNSGSFSIPRKIFGSPEFNCTEEKISLSPSGRVSNIGNHNKSANFDVKGESNIISDILSLDFDPWDDSLFSSDNFTRFFGGTGKLEGSFSLSGSFKSQSSHQSRFSFAHQESQANISEPLLTEESHAKEFDLSQDVHKKGYQSGMLFNGFEGSKPVISTHDILSDRSSGMSKVNVSAPPGFTAPNRVPPPGFSPQDRFIQKYDTSYSDNHLSSSNGDHYQAPLVGNSGDVEFIDPAILAIGKEPLPLKYTFPAQFSTSYSDPRLQLLMQQSISSHQNLRMSDTIGDRLFPSNESYVTSRLLAQNQSSLPSYLQMQLQHPTNSHFTNGQWDGWNDVRLGNDSGMSEIFRNGRLGLNNYYSSNEEHKFHIAVADIDNRTFGF